METAAEAKTTDEDSSATFKPEIVDRQTSTISLLLILGGSSSYRLHLHFLPLFTATCYGEMKMNIEMRT